MGARMSFADSLFHKQQMAQLPFEQRYYVDADFSQEASRCKKLLGDISEPPKLGSICPIFEERFRDYVVRKSEWKDLYEELQPKYSKRKVYQYDQKNEGTCTSNATAGAYAYTWAKQFGKDTVITPSPPTMYFYCANGPNTGSTTSCNLKRIRDHGCLPIAMERNRDVMRRLGLDPNHVCDAVGWNKPRSLPREAMEETAKNFRLDEFYEISSIEGFFGALFHGFSIMYGRAGHAIHGTDVVLRNNTWYCKYDNSWGNWGENGFGFDSESYLSRTGGFRWAYAFQTLVVPNGIEKLLDLPELETPQSEEPTYDDFF